MQLAFLDLASQILQRAIIAIIAGALLSAGGYLLNSRIRSFVKRLFHFLFDTKVQIELTNVNRYASEPTQELGMDVFKKIQAELGETSFEGLSENYLRIRLPEITTPIEIRIENEPHFGKRANSRYEVKIKTETAMTFGYRSDNCVRDFEDISTEILEIISQDCFDTQPEAQFVTGTLYGQAPMSEEEIEDESLGMRAKMRDSSLELRFDDPRHVTRGIRKYFRPV